MPRQGVLVSVTVDYGTEFTSKVLEASARVRDVKLDCICSKKITENSLIESFKGMA